jgi:hypothetical protein
MCVALAVVFLGRGTALAQTTSGSSLSSLLSSLSSLFQSSIAAAASQPSSSTATTSQPSGPPANFINAGIAEHTAFNNNAFNTTPAERQAAASQPTTTTTQIPITTWLPILANWLAKEFPALSFLSTLFGGGTTSPSTQPSTPTPPASKSGLGLVAFATVDDTALSVNGTTTARLWVQQSSPNATNDNGIFLVAVSVDASTPNVILSTVPVTIVSPFGNPAAGGVQTGSVTQTGGIQEVAAGLSITSTDKSEGTSGPVQVFNWQIKGVAAGTVTLTPTNFTSAGFNGIIDWTGATGDQTNYVPVTITVK